MICRRNLRRGHHLMRRKDQRFKRGLKLFLQVLQVLQVLQLQNVGVNFCHFGFELLFNVSASELGQGKLQQDNADFGQLKPKRLRPAHKAHGCDVVRGVGTVAVFLARGGGQ